MSELIHLTDDFAAAEQYGAALQHEILDRFGQVAVEEVRRDCPVSDIDTKGYVHMIDTVDYHVDDEGEAADGESGSVQVWVGKDYASYVNFGTTLMAARPFFTNGMERAEARIEEIGIELSSRDAGTVVTDSVMQAESLNNSVGTPGRGEGNSAQVPSGNVLVMPSIDRFGRAHGSGGRFMRGTSPAKAARKRREGRYGL